MAISPSMKQHILKGRKAVDAYRAAHAQLHSGGWYKEMPEGHTPLLEIMLSKLREQGFDLLQEFFAASDELNAKSLGFLSAADFESANPDKELDDFKELWR